MVTRALLWGIDLQDYSSAIYAEGGARMWQSANAAVSATIVLQQEVTLQSSSCPVLLTVQRSTFARCVGTPRRKRLDEPIDPSLTCVASIIPLKHDCGDLLRRLQRLLQLQYSAPIGDPTSRVMSMACYEHGISLERPWPGDGVGADLRCG